mgnify:FL=1
MKLITANPGNPRGLQTQEIYALGEDATEQNNIADVQPILGQTLAQELEEHQKRSQTGGATREQKAMAPEDEAELRALGYIE